MNIFLAIVMGPGLGFMLYALCQFWLEERRVRKHARGEAHWSVIQITSTLGAQREHMVHEGTRERNVVAITQPLSRSSARRDVA